MVLDGSNLFNIPESKSTECYTAPQRKRANVCDISVCVREGGRGRQKMCVCVCVCDFREREERGRQQKCV